MGNINAFPLVLSIKAGDGIDSELRQFETKLRGSADRASTSMQEAGRRADRAFTFNNTSREVQQLSREVDAFFQKLASKGRVQGLNLGIPGVDPGLIRQVNSQAAAEESLEAARRRNHVERMNAIGQEVSAILGGIRERQAAEGAAFRQAENEANRRIALERQRIVESAATIAGPTNLSGITLDPTAAQRSAATARAYANAQREIAEAATVAARAIGTATAEDRAYATTARQAAAAAEIEAQRLEAVAATHTKVAGALVASGGSLARTSTAAATSAGAQRAAYANLSNQIADVAVQAQLGTNAFVILLQQGSQASFALAQTGGKLAALGRFLSNPWVVAATTAAAVLGSYVTKLGEAGEASHLAKVGANALTDAQSVLGGMFDLTSGKLEKQNELLRLNARLTAINLRADAAAKNASSAKVFGQDGLSVTTRLRAGASAYLPLGIGNLVGGDYFKARENQAALAKLEQERRQAEALKNADARTKALDAVLSKSEKLDFSGLKLTGDEYRQAIIDRSTGVINEQIAKLIDESLDSGSLAKGLRNKPTKTGNGAANRIANMEEFGRDTLDRIAGIAAPFTDQPKLIQQTANAMRELADLTDDLTRKNAAYVKATGKTLPGYEKALTAAKAAAAIVDNAPVIAIQKQTDALEDQARVQELMAQGRPAEAEALQAKLAIIRQIGVELGKEPEAVAAALAKYEEQRKGLAQLTVDAQAASATRQLSEENAVLQAQLSGNERLAEIMGRRFQLEQGMAQLSDPAVQSLQEQVDLNRELTRQKQLQDQLITAQVEQARQLQGAFENFLVDPFAKGGLKELTNSITNARKQAIARELSVKLFGDMGADVETRLRNGGDAVKAAGEALNGSAKAMTDFADGAATALGGAAEALNKSADALNGAASVMRGANDDLPSLGQLTTTPTAFTNGQTGLEPYLTNFTKGLNPLQNIWDNVQPAQELADIIVTANRYIPSAVQRQGSSVGSTIAGLVNGLGGLQTVLSYAGSAIGGKGGNAINGLLGMAAFNQLGQAAASGILKAGGGTFAAAGIGQTVGNGIAGIGQGMFADSFVKLLGIKGSATGGAIGGAIGNAILPGIGGFIGGALGSIVGGLFKKNPKAYVSLSTDAYGNTEADKLRAAGKGKAERLDAAFQAGNAVFDSLDQLASAFGTGLASNMNLGVIGSYKKQYRFDPDGDGPLAHQSFSTAEEAVKAALVNAISKGVISGMRDSTKRLLTAGGDFNKALDKAVQFEGVFSDLKAYTDPLGAAIDALDKKFAGLHTIFDQAGASTEEYSKLEQLYAFQRADAVKEATVQMAGTLQSFLDSLRYSGDTGLSLRTRESNARSTFNPLAAQIMGGQRVDQDKFTETAQSYLDIARQIYGSTQQYFDLLNQVTNLTSKAITNAGGTVTPITAATTASSIAAATGTTTSAAGSTATAAITGTTTGISGTTYDVTRQIANDNAMLAQTIVEQFKAQTAAVAIPADRLAWFSRSDFVSAMQESFGLSPQKQAAAGQGGSNIISAPDMVIGLQQQTKALTERLDTLIGVTASNAAASTVRPIISAPVGATPRSNTMLGLRNA